MENEKEYSVRLRIFKGKKTFDENLKVTSEHQFVMLTPYGSMESDNYLKNITKVGFTDGEVVKVKEIIYTNIPKPNGKEGEEIIQTTYKTVDTPQEIIDAVKKAFDMEVVKVLTKEQQEILDLKADIKEMKEAITGKKTEKKVEPAKEAVKTPAANDDDSSEEEKLEAARAEYTKLFGKKPSHLMKLPGMLVKIEDKKNEQ